ncbi:unnamed protein product [Phytophthora fragariaefolia]|uniref:Unnamed protein product n=1 Tax=Phytophthora fragariaefolia TaxID=1490495 RepID=A0A9W6XH81_9STRA|nr:unnamed protein product [Phytophthora fragariaefolia]
MLLITDPDGRSTKSDMPCQNRFDSNRAGLVGTWCQPIPVGQRSHPDAGTGRSVNQSPPWDEFAQRPERGITISISRFDNPHSVMRGLYPVQEKS